MIQKLCQCLKGEQKSRVLPFLWLHGEDKQRIREEILAIKNSGISAFCAESRPYKKFCCDQWWDDFGFILKTAKELGMQVWLLDDKSFPTGYANGYLEDPERSHLRKKLLREQQIDVLGPSKSVKLCIDKWKNSAEESVLSVIAYRHINASERLDHKTAVDLTDKLNRGLIIWDVPEGVWRVCIVINTVYGDGTPQRQDYYIDMLNPESCKAMIKAVYEPQYEHFKEYFGNTFAGFFSDEPGFFNVSSYYSTLGQMHEKYPWRRDLPSLISKSLGMSKEEVLLAIPALWEDLGEITSAVRMHYMEAVTKLYRDNFSYLLGNWCRDHGVMYIGHVIEDFGAHGRLGYGAGHYFRALDGQDMAGIDLVLFQDVPGLSKVCRRSPLTAGGVTDPSFFHYTLPKLASSHSHIQKLKKNRAMCEIFGAYGWAEGLPTMKGLADGMLVSGINYFVPHAFSAREEDKDCPPHFYNKGRNVQYPLFGRLTDYMSRVASLLSEGVHRADVAVFYNVEGEWTGGRHQSIDGICRELTENLIDFDIVSYDALKDAEIKNGRLLINEEDYGALIVSESEILPLDRLKCFARLSDLGLPVIFTESLPLRSSEGVDAAEEISCFEVTQTAELCSLLRKKELCHLSGEGKGLKSLRFYHLSSDEKEIYLFHNDDLRGDVDAYLTLPQSGSFLAYEPWDNKCYRGETKGGKLHLKLEKSNMLFVIFGEEIDSDLPLIGFERERKALELCFDISIRAEGEEDFRPLCSSSKLFDISSSEGLFDFCGEVCYKTKISSNKEFSVLDLGEVGEIASVWLNGVHLGDRINSPYKFSMKPSLHGGDNDLKIIVKSNLAHRRCDSLSKFVQIPPTGILGDICLCRYENE